MYVSYDYEVERDEKGFFVVTVPSLDGCVTFTDSKDDVPQVAKEAIFCYIKALMKNKEGLPPVDAIWPDASDFPGAVLAWSAEENLGKGRN